MESRASWRCTATPRDVVVLDLMMPVLVGFGVLATMRADPVLCRTPVVVLTAKILTEAERQLLSRTAVRVLQKGEHRLADVAALVMRAAARTRRRTPISSIGPGPPARASATDALDGAPPLPTDSNAEDA